MSTMTGNKRRAILSGVVASLVVLATAGGARADVASDRPGAIIVFPKIVVDTSGKFGGVQTDTEVQLTNTSNSVIAARCWIVDATSHCADGRTACRAESAASDCASAGLPCTAQWQETDFRLTLTKRQPISWKASEGLSNLPCDGLTNGTCPNGESNRGSDGLVSSVLPVPEDPFFGEIKCVEVDPGTFQPTVGFNPANKAAGYGDPNALPPAGDLKGEATIVSVVRVAGASNTNGSYYTRDPGAVDARKYNGITIPAIGENDGNDTLCLGGGPSDTCPTGAEYSGCPSVILLNNMFDDATVYTNRGAQNATVVTDLTVVPCTEDFNLQTANTVTLQFLVFNEFEQRFSTSTRVNCWREVQLSNIDTRESISTDNLYSIFSVGVQGTLSGQIRVRPVRSSLSANGVLAISEEFWTKHPMTGTKWPVTPAQKYNGYSDATNTYIRGTNPDVGDFLILSPDK